MIALAAGWQVVLRTRPAALTALNNVVQHPRAVEIRVFRLPVVLEHQRVAVEMAMAAGSIEGLPSLRSSHLVGHNPVMA